MKRQGGILELAQDVDNLFVMIKIGSILYSRSLKNEYLSLTTYKVAILRAQDVRKKF